MFDPKLWPNPWTIPSQVKDLPRDSYIDISCRSCKRMWRQSVRHMVETERLGARYLDLLEWESRCRFATCGGMVCFAIEDEADGMLAAA